NQAVNKVITVANPGLEPWTADNFDFTVESYNFKKAILSASIFQKNLVGFFSTRSTPATRELLAEYGFSDEYLDYMIETTYNGGEATLRGLELAYRQTFNFEFLPAWSRGFQVFANYTKLRVSGPNADDFTEFSPQEFNWGV